ncbi:MAG: DUF4129 domain-containing protein [Leptolyngbyaceae cyanobacterium RU_5_1]|nr:DUF4129 domain-containing protein [Leptolyngbyaceae cyanobacterium RU_5_1]
MSGNFEKDSIDWQLYQLQQRMSEWFDRLFQPNGNARPSDWSLPDWVLRSLFWVIVVMMAVWIVWQLYRLLSPYLGRDWLPGRGQKAESQQQPAEKLTVAQWLQRSRALAQQGNYREACRALYMATIQKLDDRELIPNQLSRTDGEYLRILQTLPNPRPYQVLIRTHERLCFSNTEISEDTFNHCEQAYREIEAV